MTSDALKTYTFRLDTDIIRDIDRIVEAESKRTGYRLDRTQMVRRALVALIREYNDVYPEGIQVVFHTEDTP